MLYRSFSTVLMAVIATNLLIVLLTFCFRNTKVMINAGYKLLALFILFAVLRFSLPFALPVNICLVWPELISLAVWKVHYWLFEVAGYPISIWNIFEFIWLFGICVKILLHCLSYIKANHRITLEAKVITDKEPFHRLIEQICEECHRPNKFTIIELPKLKTPLLYGIWKPRILIPEKLELRDEEWYYVLRHEASHHFHHDILMKNIIKLITIIYWWNPFCNILYRQADVILEMRVDDSITMHDYESTDSYMHCLINVSERAEQTKTIPKAFTMSLIPKEISDTKKRFQMLIANQGKRRLPLNISLFLIAVIIYIFSYVFIVEAFHEPEVPEKFPNETIQELIVPAQINPKPLPNNDIYAIEREDGTYDLYYDDGIYLDTIDSLRYYPYTPVYTEDNRPSN